MVIWFWRRFVKIRDACVDFEPYFKVHNLVSLHPKSIILSQMTKLNMIFHVMVSVLSISQNLKLAPVPCWISERPIRDKVCFDYWLPIECNFEDFKIEKAMYSIA